jgi:hypothetical protein
LVLRFRPSFLVDWITALSSTPRLACYTSHSCQQSTCLSNFFSL